MADIERVKRNIGKMIDQGAPEADIDAYLADEGVSVDQLKTPPMSVGETAVDAVKGLGSGLVRGGAALAGLPGDISELGARGLDVATRFIGDKLGVNIAERANQKPLLGSGQILDGVQSVVGELPKPKTTLGEYAQTVGEFAPGIVAGPGGLAAGQLTKGSEAEPFARVAGALAGGFAPSALGRMVSPLPINAERAAAVNTLRGEGVTDLTAGQVTGRKPLQYLEAERGRGGNLMESQAEQFTQAALRRVGENANRATPEVIDRAFDRIGQDFDNLAARNTLGVDRQFANDIATLQRDYHFLANPMQRQVLDDAVNDVIGVIQQGNGSIAGPAYQAMRSRLDKAQRGARGSDNQLSDAFMAMRNALDDAMERSIQSSGNTRDLGAWRNARNQYRNILVVEKAATGAGEGAAAGLISPAKLREATVSTHGRRNYARGQGDFADLARAGVQTMSPLPNSGTPGRISAQNIGAGSLSLLGGVGGAANSGGDPTATALGFLAGAVAPRAIGRAATSRMGRAYLGNQAATGLLGNLNPQRAGLLSALMAAQQQRLEAPR